MQLPKFSHFSLGRRLAILVSILFLTIAVWSQVSFQAVSPQPAFSNSPTGRNPVLLWTGEQQAVWNAMVARNDPWWRYIKGRATQKTPAYGDHGDFDVLAYQMTGDVTYARAAWDNFIQPEMADLAATQTGDTNYVRDAFTREVQLYDWIYPALSPTERTEFLAGLYQFADFSLGNNTTGNLGSIRNVDSDQVDGEYFGLAWLDLVGTPENIRAGTFLSATTVNHGAGAVPVGGLDATASDTSSSMRNAIKYHVEALGGAGYGASTEYHYSTDPVLFKGYKGILTATGKDYFPEITAMLPRFAKQEIYHLDPTGPTNPKWDELKTGDAEHARSLWIQTQLNMAGLLSGLTAADPIGPYMQQITNELTQWVGGSHLGSQPYADFFWLYNPDAPTAALASLPKGFYDPAQGQTYFQGGWGGGAGDPNASFYFSGFPVMAGLDHDVKFMTSYQLFRKSEWVFTDLIGYGSGAYEAEGHNSMLIAGLSTMQNHGPIASEIDPGNKFVYSAGTTSGRYYDPSYYQPPANFLQEWTRSQFYLPASDDKSDTVVIFDRTNAQDPKTLASFSHYTANDKARINAAPNLKQWIIHSPVSPTISSTDIAWTTAGGQNVRVDTLLPASQTKTIYDEDTIWSGEYPFPSSERHFQTRIAPSTDNQWDTFLNIAQVSDAGTKLTNVLIKTSDDAVQGALIHRSGLPDVAVLFGASQGSPTIGGSYTLGLPATTAQTQLYLANLDTVNKSWSVTIDGVTANLPVSAAGIGQLLVNTTNTSTLTVFPNGNIPPATPTITSPANGSTVVTTPTLTSTAFSGANGATQAGAQWLISANNFGTTLVDTGDNAQYKTSFTPNALGNGTYYARVRYLDNQGAHSGYSPTVTFTINSVVLPATPTVATPANGATVNTVTVALTGSANGNISAAQWQVSTSANFGTITADSGVIVTNPTSYTTPALANGVYFARVRYINNVGVSSLNSAVSSFTVNVSKAASPLPLPPASPNLTSNVAANAVTLSGSAYAGDPGTNQTAAEWQLSFSNSFNSTVVNTGADPTNKTSYIISGLANGDYFARVRYQDNNGNWSAYSSTISVTIAVPAAIIPEAEAIPPSAGTEVKFTSPPVTDITPVAVTNVKSEVLDISSTSADVTSQTSEPAVVTVEYGLTTDYGSTATVGDANPLSDQTIALTDLKPNTDYHVRVTAVTNNGQKLISDDTVVTTTPAPEVGDTPPPVPVVEAMKVNGAVLSLTAKAKIKTKKNSFIISGRVFGAAESGAKTVVAKVHSLVVAEAEGDIAADGTYVIAINTTDLADGDHTISLSTKDATGTHSAEITALGFTVGSASSATGNYYLSLFITLVLALGLIGFSLWWWRRHRRMSQAHI